MPIFEADVPSLDVFKTTNDDIQYGINILPNENLRNFEQDKYIEADWEGPRVDQSVLDYSANIIDYDN